jgi:hypothetical protein
MAEPTVGRIVHYRPLADEDQETLMALITGLNDDGTVYLEIHPPGRPVFFSTHARYSLDFEPGTWSWPKIK